MPSPLRFLVAPDSFKGTFSATEAAAAIAGGLEAAGAVADRCPVADGGEGTLEVLVEARGGELRSAHVHDPLRRPIEARFGLLDDGATAVVEMARASGLDLVAPEDRDAERADTYGSGELIAAALAAGPAKVLVAVGGSATSDGGRGALEALREQGRTSVPEVEVLCDVQTPYELAALVFGPQKGADPAAVKRLTARLDVLAAELPRDPRGVPMSGCAGGLSGALWAHGARLRSGADYVLDALDFDRRLADAEAVVSGEGRLDRQSFEGKVVGAIAARCATAAKPLHLVVGSSSLGSDLPAAIASVVEAGKLDALCEAGQALASGCGQP